MRSSVGPKRQADPSEHSQEAKDADHTGERPA